MFTGLIESLGTISSLKIEGKGMYVDVIIEDRFLEEVKNGDSISVDGVCLTVTDIYSDGFKVFAMKETVDKTLLKQGSKLKGRKVNLEKSLKIGDRLDGHLVYGHVDFTTNVVSVSKEGYARILKFKLPSKQRKYIVPKGSVAVNGVSLTVKDIDLSSFSVSLIPETQDRTNLALLRTGEIVNVELDIIGKYVENFIKR
ncbi:riboflavin synthase [candidate division TA06 bacterium]|uniref:Riboflavin synthase n=1 Tax=candidate division TA06 bacterium TaxID=2250710 RepID=A0A660S8A8_UNCT6|nr:MAG: riboflavin synthase [candidate division TA06 bacterium]